MGPVIPVIWVLLSQLSWKKDNTTNELIKMLIRKVISTSEDLIFIDDIYDA